MTDFTTQYLFVIGAYRDNEVSATHPTMLTLSEMKKQGVVIRPLAKVITGVLWGLNKGERSPVFCAHSV